MEPGGIVTVVWPLGFSEFWEKEKVAELGAGRVKEGRWEVFVRGMVGFGGKMCRWLKEGGRGG